MADDFDAEQKRYLEGFSHGIAAIRMTGGLAGGGTAPAPAAEPTGPDASHIKAQDRTVKNGGKLADQEKWKRAENPFDGHNRLIAEAETGKAPKPEDNFRWRYHGLFWVAPAQNSYMCRLRIPNGILHHWQFAGIADLADAHGGGYSHVTTRANLQVREISPEHGQPFLDGLIDLGLTARARGRTTSATSPARPPPASTPRNCSTRARSPSPGTTTSSTTARSSGCRASSTSPSTAAACCRCWRRPTTSASRRSR